MEGRDPIMAKFKGGQEYARTLSKGGLRLQSGCRWCMGGISDVIRPAGVAVMVLLHWNGNLWAALWEPAYALAPFAPKGELHCLTCWRSPVLICVTLDSRGRALHRALLRSGR